MTVNLIDLNRARKTPATIKTTDLLEKVQDTLARFVVLPSDEASITVAAVGNQRKGVSMSADPAVLRAEAALLEAKAKAAEQGAVAAVEALPPAPAVAVGDSQIGSVPPPELAAVAAQAQPGPGTLPAGILPFEQVKAELDRIESQGARNGDAVSEQLMDSWNYHARQGGGI